MSSGTHRAQQEREARGFQFFWPGVPPTAQTFTLNAVTVIGFTKQEVPFHPRSMFWPGVPPAPPQVAAPQGIVALSRQEQPYHPATGTFIRKSVFPPPVPGVNTSKGYIL